MQINTSAYQGRMTLNMIHKRYRMVVMKMESEITRKDMTKILSGKKELPTQ